MPNEITKAIKILQREGMLVRHFNFDMPSVQYANADESDYQNTMSNYRVPEFFERARSVMLPGEKVFFTSEHPALLQKISQAAKEKGFVEGKPLRAIDKRHAESKSGYTRMFSKGNETEPGKPIYALELVWSQKSARHLSKQLERQAAQKRLMRTQRINSLKNVLLPWRWKWPQKLQKSS